MKKTTLKIEGMSCSACSNTIEKYLNKQNGIFSANVNLVLANATIEYDENILNLKQIEKFIHNVGYKSAGVFKLDADEKTSVKVWFIIFGILTFLVLYISMGQMFYLPIFDFLNMHKSPIIYASVLCGFSVLFLIYGFDIFKKGIKSLFISPNMDSLVTLGVLSSFIYSVFGLVMICMGVHYDVYFESCCVVIYLVKLGALIDFKSKNKTRQAIKQLVQITPQNAKILVDGQEKVVSIDEIKVDDLVVCYAGEKIAVDGEIISGTAHFDESIITGESLPCQKTTGDQVIAGSYNYDGFVTYKAKKIGKDSTISSIVNLVVEATNTKMPIAKTVDKVSKVFVPVIIAIAVITFVVYLCLGFNFETSLITFVTILLISCPCSLGLATPLAVVISEGLCAKNGILIKKSESLELFNKANVIVFDKTGTLTYGKLKISNFINLSKLSDEIVLSYAGALEQKSTHPISTAFSHISTNLNVENFTNLNGLGISGNIQNDFVAMGSEKLLKQLKIKNKYTSLHNQILEQGNSVIYLCLNNEIIAIFGVNDIIKQDMKNIIEVLNKKVETIMLTGDSTKTATLVANQLGIKNVIANVMPNEKADVIKQLKSQNKIVIMCGDGINDCPALALADVGVSVNNGTDIAMDSADVVLLKDMSKILDLFEISKHTITNIKQNLFWAFFYNCLMIPIAVGVFRFANIVISPMIAGLSMVFSSLTVTLNALRLYNIKGVKMFNRKITTTITVEGMHCQHCADHVKDALKKIDGVKNVKVDIQTKQVEIISTKQLDLTCVENIINQLGYELKK